MEHTYNGALVEVLMALVLPSPKHLLITRLYWLCLEGSLQGALTPLHLSRFLTHSTSIDVFPTLFPFLMCKAANYQILARTIMWDAPNNLQLDNA